MSATVNAPVAPKKIILLKLEYIWIDSKSTLRSKTKLVPTSEEDIQESRFQIPEWTFDGSSTGQANTTHSEVLLRPKNIFTDPFRGAPHLLVLCETYNIDETPHTDNYRQRAFEIFETAKAKNAEFEPIFGFEQEFFLMDPKTRKPIGFTNIENEQQESGSIVSQGRFYCGAGSNSTFGRACVEEAFNNCLTTGISLTGLNAEVAPGQWELQICSTGLTACDQLWITRYILQRTAENHGLYVSFEPKVLDGDWNCSGCHTNFSTKAMRDQTDGLKEIQLAIGRLEKRHDLHIEHYGMGNKIRLTGTNETSSFEKFTWGVGDRNASVRIPEQTHKTGMGYFEDRRPSSNMDPYIVATLIMKTVCLDD